MEELATLDEHCLDDALELLFGLMNGIEEPCRLRLRILSARPNLLTERRVVKIDLAMHSLLARQPRT